LVVVFASSSWLLKILESALTEVLFWGAWKPFQVGAGSGHLSYYLNLFLAHFSSPEVHFLPPKHVVNVAVSGIFFLKHLSSLKMRYKTEKNYDVPVIG
jgi:hypothetical protein